MFFFFLFFGLDSDVELALAGRSSRSAGLDLNFGSVAVMRFGEEMMVVGDAEWL